MEEWKGGAGRFLFFYGFGAWMPRKVVRKSLVDRERLQYNISWNYVRF